MNKYEKALKTWNETPIKRRGKGYARQLAKSVGLKSVLEIQIAVQLTQLQRQKLIAKFEYEPEVWEYQHEPQHYTPDFRVTLPDGSVQFYEAKGKMTNETRRKLRSIKRCNPDKDFKIVFERSENKLHRAAKMTYGKWADREKFVWSNQIINKSWLKGE